jgi:hypothetical protein
MKGALFLVIRGTKPSDFFVRIVVETLVPLAFDVWVAEAVFFCCAVGGGEIGRTDDGNNFGGLLFGAADSCAATPVIFDAAIVSSGSARILSMDAPPSFRRLRSLCSSPTDEPCDFVVSP